jgi:hypothetical protein
LKLFGERRRSGRKVKERRKKTRLTKRKTKNRK